MQEKNKSISRQFYSLLPVFFSQNKPYCASGEKYCGSIDTKPIDFRFIPELFQYAITTICTTFLLILFENEPVKFVTHSFFIHLIQR